MKCLKNFSSALCMILIFSCVMISCGEDNEEIFPTPPTPSTSSPTIILSAEALTLEIGETYTLVASFDPSDTPNKAHTWTSSDPSVVTVDETGLLNALKIGEAVITATALDGGNTAQCKVSVVEEIIPITSITLDRNNASIIIGEKIALNPTVAPNNTTEIITWNSSNAGIASVDEKGNVLAISIGTANITASNSDGSISATCEVEVVGRSVTLNHPEVNNITQNSANIKGSITNMGMTIEESGICYSTEPTPTIENNCIPLNQTEFEYKLSSLVPETTYYVRLYAVVNGETSYSSQLDFTTLGEIVTNFEVTKISKNSVTLTSPAPYGIDTINVCYSTHPNPLITDNITKAIKNQDDNKLYLNIVGLEYGTTYYIRPYGIASANVEYYDNETSVTTLGNGNGDIVLQHEPIKLIYPYPFHLYVTVDYEIKIEGLYSVQCATTYDPDLYASDINGNFSELIYVNSGSGQFHIKCHGYQDKTDINNIFYKYNTGIIFTNLETGVIYEYLISGEYHRY